MLGAKVYIQKIKKRCCLKIGAFGRKRLIRVAWRRNRAVFERLPRVIETRRFLRFEPPSWHVCIIVESDSMSRWATCGGGKQEVKIGNLKGVRQRNLNHCTADWTSSASLLHFVGLVRSCDSEVGKESVTSWRAWSQVQKKKKKKSAISPLIFTTCRNMQSRYFLNKESFSIFGISTKMLRWVASSRQSAAISTVFL